MSKKRFVRRVFKGFAIASFVGLLGVAALIGSLRLEHGIDVTLPPPTGPFAVGRTLYDWRDDKTLDALAPTPGTSRELLVWVWYPASANPSGATDDYLPAPSRAAVVRSRGQLISGFLTRDLSKVHDHALRNATISPQQPPFPVVIMRGGASAAVWNYSTLAEDLASHGYVVVGIDAPYRTDVAVFPDGRVTTRRAENDPEPGSGTGQAERATKVLAAWTADIAFVLDRLERLNAADSSGIFAGRLDMARVGVFGHSFGGAQAAQFCSEDSRCKAGIDIDGSLHGSVIQAGIHRPFMFLLSDHSKESDPESGQILADIQSVYERLPSNGRVRIEIRGSNHFMFSDDGAVLKSKIFRGVMQTFGMLRIDGRRQLAVTTYCVRSFFDAYLKGPGDSRLELASTLYPEIQDLK